SARRLHHALLEPHRRVRDGLPAARKRGDAGVVAEAVARRVQLVDGDILAPDWAYGGLRAVGADGRDAHLAVLDGQIELGRLRKRVAMVADPEHPRDGVVLEEAARLDGERDLLGIP